MLKENASYRTPWRTSRERGFGPVSRTTT